MRERFESAAGVVALRPASPDDERFLSGLYATTRDDLRAVPGWSEDQLAQVVDLQFRAQQADYATNFPAEGHRIIELAGRPVGRVWVDRRPDELVIVDMALLPGHRSAGIGTLLIREIFEDADQAGLPVRLTSEQMNPRAIALYERLGFVAASSDGLFVSLVREPV